MKSFLQSLPLLSLSLMITQVTAGIISIPVALVAALLFDPVNSATFAAAGLGASASLAYLIWQYATVQTRAEQRHRLETAGYVCTMGAILFLGALVLGAGLPKITDFDHNASIMAFWLTKGLWYIAILYVETGCLLFCWSVDMFVKMPAE